MYSFLVKKLSFGLSICTSHENRRKGAKKAAKTRREKTKGQPNQGKSSEKKKGRRKKEKQRRQSFDDPADQDEDEESVVCVVCDKHDPLPSNDLARDEMVSSVQCDGCLSWCHLTCAEVEEDNVPERWLCLRCSEVW